MNNRDDSKAFLVDDPLGKSGTETTDPSQSLLTRRDILKHILQYATASAGALALNIFPENLHPSTITEYRAAEINSGGLQIKGTRR